MYRLASALADAWELVKGGRDVLTSVVEIDDFRDFPRVNPEIFDEFVDSLPDPGAPSATKMISLASIIPALTRYSLSKANTASALPRVAS